MEVSSNQMNLSNFAGIRREYTTPYSPEQNGIAERMNRAIQERVVSMLQHSGLSDNFWAEALLTAIHIIKMSPSRPLGLKIPQEIWTGSKPNYDKLRIFCCEAYALIPKDDRRKLEPRSDTDSGTPSIDKSSKVRT